MVTVPRAWPGETVVLLATGPSLTAADVDACRGHARVIAVSDAYRLAPWADALYACDCRWWRWHQGVPTFTGAKWSLDQAQWRTAPYPDVQRLRNTGTQGLEVQPTGLRNGRNSGYQALNLAFHYGARRVLLLGYDMASRPARTHFFGEHPVRTRSPYSQFIERFLTIAEPLRAHGVEVLNCTPDSALTAFPRAALRQVLPAAVAVA